MLSTSQRVASRYALTASFHAPQAYRYAPQTYRHVPQAGTRSTMSGQPVESAIAAWIRAQTVDTLTLPASSAHPATTTLRQCIVDALDAPSEDHQRTDTITTVLRLRKDLAMTFAGDAHWTCVAHARLLVDSLDDNEPDSGGPLHARIIDATAEELRHPVDGLRALVDWRADVLDALRTPAYRSEPSLRALDVALRSRLHREFDAACLTLSRIEMDKTPRIVLENILRGDAVHAINDWAALEQRLGPRRRCYALFHPRLPDDPLVFIQVALTDQVSSNVQEILGERPSAVDENRGSCAIFYSISATERGLAGIDLGHALIKRVVAELRQTLPAVHVFCTLSPIPGLAEFVARAEMTGNGAFFRGIVDDIDAFSHALRQFQHAPNAEMTFKSRSFSDVLKQLTLRYLMTPKRNVETDRGGVVDSVANFHMRNGAMIYRVNVLGDRSPKGLRQSYGMMANYLYDLELIEQNREAFRKDGKVVVSSKL